MLSPQHGEQLLKLATDTVVAHVRGQPLPAPLDSAGPPFDAMLGLFVTLYVAGELRGCMGTFQPDLPLGRLVREMTLTSLADPRFFLARIEPRDLPRLTVQLSILSPLVRSPDPLAELVPGRHGVLIRVGPRSGCFLPQVATEMGWGAMEMLRQCCAHKAGLPAMAWRRPDAEVYLFTAQIIPEPEAEPG